MAKVKRSELLRRIEALEAMIDDLAILRKMLVKAFAYKPSPNDPLAQRPTFNSTYTEAIGKWLEQRR